MISDAFRSHAVHRTATPWWAMAGLIAACVGLMLLDHVTGPYVRVSLLFVVPVALAAYRWNWMIGVTVGVLLSSSRIWLVLKSNAPWLVLPEMANLGMSLVLFAVVSVLAQRVRLRKVKFERSDLVTVCGGCGRVLDAEGQWRRFERLASTFSLARFAHTVCPECEGRFGSAKRTGLRPLG